MNQFVRTLRGRYDNANLVQEAADQGMGPNQQPPGITMTFAPVNIRGLGPLMRAMFFSGSSGGDRVAAIYTYQSLGRGKETHIRHRGWAVKRPEEYEDAWEEPWLFESLELTQEENENLMPVPQCDTRYRQQENGDWVSEGTSEACRIPRKDGSGVGYR